MKKSKGRKWLKIILWSMVGVFVFLFLIGLLGMWLDDSPKQDKHRAKITETRPVQNKKVHQSKEEKQPLVLLYEIARGNNAEIYAYLTERPTNKADLLATLKSVYNKGRESMRKQDMAPYKNVTVWLYTSEEKATTPSLKSGWVANYVERQTDKLGAGNAMYNDELLDLINKKGGLYKPFIDLRKYFHKKGVDMCDYYTRYQGILKESRDAGELKYGNSLTPERSTEKMDYEDKYVENKMKMINKKYGISKERYEQTWQYGQYACDNFIE